VDIVGKAALSKRERGAVAQGSRGGGRGSESFPLNAVSEGNIEALPLRRRRGSPFGRRIRREGRGDFRGGELFIAGRKEGTRDYMVIPTYQEDGGEDTKSTWAADWVKLSSALLIQGEHQLLAEGECSKLKGERKGSIKEGGFGPDFASTKKALERY